jgi:hypothetical protein
MPDDPPATPLRDTVSNRRFASGETWRLDFDVSPEANLRFDADVRAGLTC